MDSDDEVEFHRFHAQLRARKAGSMSRLIRSGPLAELTSNITVKETNILELKLYQIRERENMNIMVYESTEGSKSTVKDSAAIYRFHRFFDSIKGFHKVREAIPLLLRDSST